MVVRELLGPGRFTVDTVHANLYSGPMIDDADSTETTRGLNPWGHTTTITLDMIRAADEYLDARPIEQQIAVMALMREVEG